MDSREKDFKCSELWAKSLLKPIRRDSMQHKPNMCLDANGYAEFHSGQSERVKDKIHAVCLELFRDLISSSHSAVSATLLPLLDTLV